jgi:hypothetical protein
MKISRHGALLLFPLLAVALSLTLPADSQGQGKGKGKTPAPAAAPVVNPLTPTGAQRGQTLDLNLAGANLAGPTGMLLGFPAKVSFPVDEKEKEPNGSDNAKLRVKLEIPADAPIGFHPLRLATTRGVSNLRLFCIDDLPQVVEVGANRMKTPQAVPLPCVVVGATDAEQGDVYKFSVQAGQSLSFDLIGRRMGSTIDAQLSIFNAKTMREVAHDNDSPGCQTDPRIRYTFKEAGEYLVEVKDVLYRGGAEFFYRLRIGDFPLATTPYPLAAKRGSKAKIGFIGSALDGVAPVEVDIPTDPMTSVVWIAPKGKSGLHGWPVALTVSDLDETTETEPNQDAKTANRIAVPAGISGRFEKGDDSDTYVFTAKKGQKLLIEAQTLELNSPSLVYVVLKNAKGAELAKSNAQAVPPLDQRIEFTASEDGDYFVEVSHLNFAGGPSEVYRLTVRPASNGFDLTLPADRFDLAASSVVPIPVQVTRRGYTGPIELSIVGPAGLVGTSTVKAGQNAGVVVVFAKGETPMGAYSVTVQGKATVDGQPITQLASVRGTIGIALGGIAYPPLHLHHPVALAVKEKAPFGLTVTMNPPDGVPGTTPSILITAKRDAGFTDEITLIAPTGLPANVPVPKITSIPKDKNEISFPLDLNGKAPPGDYFVLFTAKAKHQDKEYTAAALPLALTVGMPFDLKVEPSPLVLTPGQTGKLKLTAIRKGGYKGPIALEIRKLPANVTAGKAMFAADQSTTEVDIIAAPTAAPGDKTDVDVLGTASALNNLQNASPAFTVRIQKK